LTYEYRLLNTDTLFIVRQTWPSVFIGEKYII